MVFDVESVGLHGEGFAVGWVVVDERGNLRPQGLGEPFVSGYWACSPDDAEGDDEGRAWVQAHVVPHIKPNVDHPETVRTLFWDAWQYFKAQGAVLVADCAWPVEARFLAACVDDDPLIRNWGGPYPLHDVATMRLAAGFDPQLTMERRDDELPVHHPLADARQSARLWVEALEASK
jgi:hypothetical protein